MMIGLKPVLKPVEILGTGIVLVILGAILIALSFNYTLLSSWSYWDSTYPVEANSTGKVGLGLILKDHILVGKISCDIGKFLEWDNRTTIFFSMEDSSGNTFFAPLLVNGSYRFVFQAPKDDFFYYYFDNTNTSLGSSSYYRKFVFWQIYYYGNFTMILQTSGSIFGTSGIICIGIYLLKAKEPGKTVKDIPDLADRIIRKIIKSTKRQLPALSLSV